MRLQALLRSWTFGTLPEFVAAANLARFGDLPPLPGCGEIGMSAFFALIPGERACPQVQTGGPLSRPSPASSEREMRWRAKCDCPGYASPRHSAIEDIAVQWQSAQNGAAAFSKSRGNAP